MLAFNNCGGYNLDNSGVSRVECPVPIRQTDCPAGLLFSNGKCINTEQNQNWVSSDPYLKSNRVGYRVQYTQLSKPTPTPSLSKIPSPLAPSVSPNTRSVQEYLKQVEEERKSTEQERYYAMSQYKIGDEHIQRVNKIENDFKNNYAQVVNSFRSDFKNKVDELKVRRQNDITPIINDRQNGVITNKQYEQKLQEIIQRYNNEFEVLKASAQSGLDQAINKINEQRIFSINESETKKVRELAELDQQYASRSIPIPSAYRSAVTL